METKLQTFTLDKSQIINILEKELIWDKDLKLLYNIVEELEHKGKNVLNDFIQYANKKLQYAVELLQQYDVDINKLSEQSWSNYIVSLFKNWADKVDDNTVIVYGKTMGFIWNPETEEWEVFEGSDEPDDLDLYLYSKLILQNNQNYITLYGMHNLEFVENWRTEGIPENVYFTSKKSIALHYWHANTNDVLVKIKIPADAIIQTADFEFKTIRKIDVSEIKLLEY